MTLNENTTAVVKEVYSFTEVVDEACDKLKEKQIKYSIQRIQLMEDNLSEIEKELNEFLGGKNNEKFI